MHSGTSGNAPFSNKMVVMLIIDLQAEKEKRSLTLRKLKFEEKDADRETKTQILAMKFSYCGTKLYFETSRVVYHLPPVLLTCRRKEAIGALCSMDLFH